MAEAEGLGGSKAQVSRTRTDLVHGLHCFSPRLLDVGAVRPDNYRTCASWIDVTPIDLHSRHPSILEQDLLRMDQDCHREAWDIISLSLVLNFVPDGKDRGTLVTCGL
jgi:25S rRNA (adenine(2142)-N(1))-methyltransferase, Bmt2